MGNGPGGLDAVGRLMKQGGGGVQQMLAEAEQQAQMRRQMEAQLELVYKTAFENPPKVQRACVHRLKIVGDDIEATLLVGLPTGERWDIPLPGTTLDDLAQAIAALQAARTEAQQPEADAA